MIANWEGKWYKQYGGRIINNESWQNPRNKYNYYNYVICLFSDFLQSESIIRFITPDLSRAVVILNIPKRKPITCRLIDFNADSKEISPKAITNMAPMHIINQNGIFFSFVRAMIKEYINRKMQNVIMISVNFTSNFGNHLIWTSIANRFLPLLVNKLSGFISYLSNCINL